MPYEIDINEVSTCLWRRVRRTGRRLTLVYDRALAPSGVSANQFDILANLFAARLQRRDGVSLGELAAPMGMHPTTLTRELKPMIARGWVAQRAAAHDRRTRPVALTELGCETLRAAVPLWRGAQRGLEAALGPEASKALSATLDLAFEKSMT